MARVPNGGLPSIKPAATALPYSRVDPTPAAFGALTGQAQSNLGNAVGSLGEDAGKILLDINKENLNRQAKYSDNEYGNVIRTSLYGDGTDNNPGLLNMQGQQAIDALPGVMQNLADARVRIGDGLTNQVAQDMFTTSANERDDVALKNATMHVGDQRRVANETASNMRQASAEEDGATGAADPDTVTQNEMIVEAEARSRAVAKGLPQDAVDAYTKDQVSQYYEKVITGRMESNTDAAKLMFAVNGDKIGGIETSRLQQRLEVKSRTDIQQKWAQEDHAHQQMLWGQTQNYNKLVGDLNSGKATGLDIQVASDANRISGEQTENLLGFIRSKKMGEPGDQNAFMTSKYLALKGQFTLEDVMKQPGLDPAMRDQLLTIVDQVQNRGGPHDIGYVKDGQKQVDMTVGGVRGPFAIQEDATKNATTANAIEYYNQQIDAENKTGTLTPERVSAITQRTIDAFRPPSISNPQSVFATYPKSAYWPWGFSASRKSLDVMLQSAAVRLQADAWKIPPDEFTRQRLILQKYAELINRVPEKSIPTQFK